MAFTAFPRHSRHGPSSWSRSVVLQKPAQDEEPRLQRSAAAVELKPSLSCSDLTQLRKSSLRSVESAPSSPVLKSVKFHSTQLEQVRLFLKSQTPMELHEPCEPELQLKYMNWPPRETTFCCKNIRVDKKFSLCESENDPTQKTILGRLQVRNLAYKKSVSVRYTFDCWNTLHDTSGKFLKTSTGMNSIFDTFVFDIPLADALKDRGQVRATVDFAVRYSVDDQEFWDNNDGQDYKIQIVAAALGDKDDDDDDLDKRELCQLDEGIEIPIARRQSKHLGTRYNFGQSLSRAKKNTTLGLNGTASTVPTTTLVEPFTVTLPPSITSSPSAAFPSRPSVSSQVAAPTLAASAVSAASAASSTSSLPAASPAPSKSGATTPTADALFNNSPSGSPPCHPSISQYIPGGFTNSLDLDSASYIDLVNKYCFYGSRSPSPMPING